ncbi:methionine ABC transporter ATP-binding protein [Roseateles aquatilis]|uniref:Methionine ABC transporter ATP-binding protein n=1 Tax=Roseateles aquatilis TaxID=431061 RepID=A0A246IZ82_9BURK|nr:ATP-binding cassette domain-containing protein [Roseateles aquatilis]OWQ85658.1 methionine ABC transporter ATP-binding protein [Roseateles aquatilis]
MSEAPLLSVRDLRFRWPGAARDTLDIPEFTLHAGESVFLRGPSGCGKSTLLSLITGVLTAEAGEVALLGQSWRALSGARRDRHRADHVGYIFQQFNLLPYRSARDNALLSCAFSRRRARRAGDAGAQASLLLARMGIDADTERRRADQLSVGQQQRVAAVRALLGRPELVIADEPTSALDEDHRDRFMALLHQACRDAGSALLFVSHDGRLAPAFSRVLDLARLNRAAAATATEAA